MSNSDISSIPISDKQTKYSGKPTGVYADKNRMLLDPSKKTKLCLTQEGGKNLSQMETVFQKSFEPICIIPSDKQEVQSGEENTITATEIFPAVKTLKAGKAAGCDQIQPRMPEMPGTAFLKGTERLANCGDHPIHKKGDRSNATTTNNSLSIGKAVVKMNERNLWSWLTSLLVRETAVVQQMKAIKKLCWQGLTT